MNRESEYVHNMREIARLAGHFKEAGGKAEKAVERGETVDAGTLKWSRKTLEKMRKLWDESF